jgi:hypothetical protein
MRAKKDRRSVVTCSPGPGEINRTRESLTNALDSILAALGSLGGLPKELPPECFNFALASDADHVKFRQAFQRTLSNLIAASPQNRTLILALEAAANDLAVSAATVGWSVVGKRKDSKKR